MLTGLVSVTFRGLAVQDIIRLTKEAGLDGIEWGGDVHCPPGQPENARLVVKLMEENALSVISYGSYYHVGCGEDFKPILDTAVILRTGNIRIWAGKTASIETNEENWQRAVKDTRQAADMAAACGLTVSFEYHAGTLTDTLPSTLHLLQEVNRDNVFSYWQPPVNSSVEDNLGSLQTLVKLHKLKNLHLFSWNGHNRLPLGGHGHDWRQYVAAAVPSDPALLLEFVKDDDPKQFFEDAEFLKNTLKDGAGNEWLVQ